MFDYRARKLYWLLFAPITGVLLLFLTFILPIIAYYVGSAVADVRIWEVAFSLVFWVVVYELIYTMIIAPLYSLLVRRCFQLFIDIVPTQGRSQDEADFLVFCGEKNLALASLPADAYEWTKENLESYISSDWVMDWFYRKKIEERYSVLWSDADSNHGTRRPDVKELFEQRGLKIGLIEKVVCRPMFRRLIITYLWFGYLLVAAP